MVTEPAGTPRAAGRPLRCLLISSVAPPDPDNGDAQYTRDLIADPPRGVEYVRYIDALATGELEWGPSLRDRPWQGIASATARAALHVLRSRGILLPDPVRWLRVRGAFDLVHIHCFPVRFLGPHPPIVLSDSAGTWWYWTAGRGMSPARVDRLLRRERRAARAFGYVHPSAYPDPARRRLFAIDSARQLLERVGVDPSTVEICPLGVPAALRAAQGDGRTILFIARDFHAKGGDVALAAFERVRREVPDARLLVVGTAEPGSILAGVEWLGLRTREELYRDIYPSADVFLYPTRFDAAPLVVAEALAHGVPVVTTAKYGLPDLVRDGETGVLVPEDDAPAAARAVAELLRDPERRARLSAAARADFDTRLSAHRRNELLGQAYRDAAR
jgi:glycosyltransferase involved in cell wall biosynthesis